MHADGKSYASMWLLASMVSLFWSKEPCTLLQCTLISLLPQTLLTLFVSTNRPCCWYHISGKSGNGRDVSLEENAAVEPVVGFGEETGFGLDFGEETVLGLGFVEVPVA